MRVAELWRYPVKSLGGERLEVADVRVDGIAGDRLLQVRDASGALVTARTRPRLLRLHARAGADGEAALDGVPWDAPASAQAVRDAAGAAARLARAPADDRFDDTPLLVATDGAIERLGADGRRLRPNIVIADVEGLAERDWPGRRLRAGGVEIAVEKLCVRCVVTTYDPDTLEQDASVLEAINERFDRRIALNCHVGRPGRVAVGDPVELV